MSDTISSESEPCILCKDCHCLGYKNGAFICDLFQVQLLPDEETVAMRYELCKPLGPVSNTYVWFAT